MNGLPSSLLFRELFFWSFPLLAVLIISACHPNQPTPPLPDEFKQGGAFIKKLPYYNPDSCVLLIRLDVPKQWQGAAYQNLFLDGPEDSSFELGFQHLDAYEKNFPADSATAFAQYWRARLYFYQGKTAEAIRAHLSAQAIIDRLEYCPNQTKYDNFGGLATAYNQSGNHREALGWLQKSLDLAQTDTTQEGMNERVDALHSQSINYRHMNLLDSAMLTAQMALDLHQKHHSNTQLDVLLRIIGSVHLLKNDCATAMRYFQQAKAVQKQAFRLINPLNIEMGKAYLCLGKLDSAEILFNALRESSYPIDANHALWNLGKIHAQKGQFKAAFEALEAKIKLTDKLYTPEKMQEMGAAKVELELERAEHKAAEAAHQKQTAREHLLRATLLFLLAVVFLFSLWLRQRAQRRILEQQNQLLEQKQTMLEQEKDLAEVLALIKSQELQRSEAELHNTRNELKTTAQMLQLKEALIQSLELRFDAAQQNGLSDLTAPPSSSSSLEVVDPQKVRILTEADWRSFRERFSEHFPGLIVRIKAHFPDMTQAEMRHFILIKLRFDTREISEALGISPESVYRSRGRLVKKLGLEGGAHDLDHFVQQFG